MNAGQLQFHWFDFVWLQRQYDRCRWKGITLTANLLYLMKGWVLLNPFRNYIPKTAMWTRRLIEPYLISVAKNVRRSSDQKYTLETNPCKLIIKEILSAQLIQKLLMKW